MNISITRDDLARLFSRPRQAGAKRAIYDAYADVLVSAEAHALLAAHGIDRPARWVPFAATMGVETGGLTIVWESGAYTADGLLRVFGAGRHSAAISPAEARRLAGNGPAIFERVYGAGNPRKARELGNTQPGDGWRFRGLGLSQITGREAHERTARKLGCPVEDLARPINLLRAALVEWDEKKCNALCDGGNVIGVRQVINGGSMSVPVSRLNGVAQYRAYVATAARIWDGSISADTAPDAAEMRLGDTGPEVSRMQKLLAAAGYPCGDADGKFGPLTERSIAGFQVNRGLTGTGRLDGDTLAALETATPPPPRDVTAADLKARGSTSIGIFERIGQTARALWVGMFGTAGLEASGVEVVNTVTAGAESMVSALGKVGGPAVSATQGKVLAITVALGLVGWMLASWATAGIRDREEKARSGQDVSK